jgi:hypothetical protein
MSDLISTLRSKKTGVETEPPAEKQGWRSKLEDAIKAKLNIPVGKTERELERLRLQEDEALPASVRG